MFKHYLASALHHFARHKTTTIINVVCLAIGFACFFVAHWTVTWSQSSDRHFPNADRIYAITERMSVGGDVIAVPRAGGLAAQFLKTDFPQLEAVARATFASETMIRTDATGMALRAAYADPEFLNIFALPFLAGDSQSALRTPNGVVVTEEAAIRLFGRSIGVVGRHLRDGDDDLVVTGVIGALKQPSHMGPGPINLLRFDVLVAMEVLERRASTGRMLKRWQVSPAFTYVVLPNNGSLTASSFKDQLQSFGARHVSKEACDCVFGAIPISELGTTGFDGIVGTAKTGISSVTLLYLICGLALAIACINYANLVTAQAAARAKETSVRRIVGARRGQIISQHLIEAVLQSGAAFIVVVIALTLITAAIPLPGKDFIVGFALRSPVFWSIALAALFGAIALAGAYPAFVLSRMQPTQALRGGRGVASSRRLTSLLVGVQFVVSSVLLIGILVMKAQNDEVRRAALETASDPLVVLSSNLKFAGVDFEVLRTELQRQPHIHSVSGAMFAPWGNAGCNQENVVASPDSSSRRWIVCGASVASGFFATTGIEVLAGRVFAKEYADNAATGDRNVVIDRALAEQYGWSNPEAAIGENIYRLNWFDSSQPPQLRRVVGVVENKTLAPVGYGATSYVYDFAPDSARFPIVRVAKSDVPAALKEMNAVWTALSKYPLQWKFADEILNDTYSLFVTMSRILSVIAGLTLLIAVLGLIGMSIHVINRRTHEIGVRKTLGASVREVLSLLLKDFSRPILIANLIAWPLAYVVMQSYLRIFTRQTGLTGTPFIISLVITLLIGWAAVLIQATRAARLNPANVLRHE